MHSPHYFEAADSAQYMEAAHKEILATGRCPFACSLIAMDIAALLRRDGCVPRLLVLRGQKIDAVNAAPLTPVTFRGAVSWGAHILCENSGLAYDPIVSDRPEETGVYLETAFAEAPEIGEIISGARLDDLFAR